MDCCCCNNFEQLPDTAPCPVELDVPEIIKGLDQLLNTGRDADAAEYLKGWLAKAREVGDWRAELSVLSEQLGVCRKLRDSELAFSSADKAQEIIDAHRLGNTVSGATVLLNVATTLKCFGKANASLPIFSRVEQVFKANLDPNDYRMAGLYNNMALSYIDIAMYAEAEKYFMRAIDIVSTGEHPENEIAVTYCNLADMFAIEDSEDKRIAEYIEKAYAALCTPDLPHDGYHGYTIAKCLSCFERFGFFVYAKELRERMEQIRASL